MAQTYKSQIMAWNWELIIRRAKLNPQEDMDGNTNGYEFIGTVFNLTPSGKFYTPFANSNVTESEAAKDEVFMNALEAVARKHGGFIDSGEGDPCDLFFVIPLDANSE